MMVIELALGLAAIAFATAVIWLACDHLERASHALASGYGIPEIVKGSVIMAVSSSFPELATVVLAGGIHGDFELGLATIVGSAIFNILVIPAAAVFSSGKPIRTGRNLVFRETQFYLISVMVVLLTLSLSVLYNPVADGRLEGELTRSMAILPLAFYVLYVYIQYHEIRDHQAETRAASSARLVQWLRLFGSMVVVALGVELLLRTAINLGHAVGTPSYLWGVTIIAAATSVPDLFLSIKAARRKSAVSSISNVLGSNIFDLLAVLPVGVIASGTVFISFRHIVPIFAVLIAATITMLLLMRRNFRLTRRDAVALLVLYAAFIAWIGLETFGAIGSGER